jgi:alcohol dehydrogenase YqhD (iron-dependent ADH family)
MVAEKQTTLMREMMAELGMAQEVRASYISKIIGHSVGSIHELTRAEGLAVVKQLLQDKQHLDGGIDESFIDF